jgi:hypothetical protein
MGANNHILIWYYPASLNYWDGHVKRIFGTWVQLNSIKLTPILRYIVTRPLCYKKFRGGEFPLDYSSETCNFCLSYILLNLGIKIGTHIHTCILYMQKNYLEFLEVRKYGFRDATVTQLPLNPTRIFDGPVRSRSIGLGRQIINVL